MVGADSLPPELQRVHRRLEEARAQLARGRQRARHGPRLWRAVRWLFAQLLWRAAPRSRERRPP